MVKTAVALLAISSAAASAVSQIRVDPQTGSYVDEFGRVRIFHGVNVVYKKAPWYPTLDSFNPTDSLDETTMQNLREWGFNVVRLGVMWPGVEPSFGQIDDSYLSTMTSLIERMGEHGVYTIADLHQDVGSLRFCGEGFPEHYVDKLLGDSSSGLAKAKAFPAPNGVDLHMNASGFPDISECQKHEFAQYYFTDQVGALWKELYTPGTDLNEGFGRFWGAVATAMKDTPAVLAYELLNEPSGFCLGGNALSCLKVVEEIFGNPVETSFLTPLYQAAAQKIRGAGAQQPILYEAGVLPRVGAEPFDGPVLENDPQQGLAYHVYCAPGDGDGVAADLICRAALELYEHTYNSFLKKHRGIGAFLTEFGAVGGNKGELKHLDLLLKFADRNFQSWAYWQLKTYEDITTANSAESLYDADGNLEVAKLKTLSRTYAQAIAGNPLRMSFNPNSGHFQLEYEATVAEAPTEIYFNKDLYYPNGYDVKADPSECLSISEPEKNYLNAQLVDVDKCLNQTMKITLSAKEVALV